ncbi:MAG TPA: alpha/beta fold hydrolase [Adhaeribacter sp.]|nr:alpha/beta fold hydrolase [Adhaeribacter sp.]
MKKALFVAIILFLCLNPIAAFHAYRFTHFATEASAKTAHPMQLSGFGKLKTLLFGVKNPRPENIVFPQQPYQTIYFTEGEKKLEGWLLPASDPQGTVVLFHGFGGQKASLLDKAAIFQELQYQVLLVDFRGSGGSEGNQTTIGFAEAEDVKTVGKYLEKLGEENVVLFGTSMGAVAIMKAVHDKAVAPTAIILECPFGTTLQTVQSRFKTMGVPAFPMAHLLAFWGGALNGFNAYAHNPVTYASNISCPTLLLYGEQDEKVSLQETEAIFKNLAGPKALRKYPNAGHENYLSRYRKEWTADVANFLNHEKP